MKAYATEAIRNLAVIGHGDAGKTQLISSLLFVAGATSRWAPQPHPFRRCHPPNAVRSFRVPEFLTTNRSNFNGG
jgi:AAA15 family ATPase/GTPase